MTLSDEDTRYLRASAVLLLVGLLLGAGLAGFSYFRWQQALQQQRIAAAQALEAKNRLAQASKEEVELREKITRYLDLRQRGIVGAERRLDWLEQFALIRRERKLGDMQYELSPQHPVERTLLTGGADIGAHQFMTSTFKVSASMLHEADLSNLIGDFRDRLAALTSVRSCTLERRATDDRSLSLNYGLKGECTLELVTIKEPGA